jgi:hypothetical protein
MESNKRINRRRVISTRKAESTEQPLSMLTVPSITITPCETTTPKSNTLLQKRKRRDSFYLDEETLLVKRIRNDLTC